MNNPAECKAAFNFAVLMGVAFAKDRFGQRGVFRAAAPSGLGDPGCGGSILWL
jgi:hypothetical protein